MIEVVETYEKGLIRATVTGGKQPVEIVELAPYDESFFHQGWRRRVTYRIPTRYVVKHSRGNTTVPRDYWKAVKLATYHANRKPK